MPVLKNQRFWFVLTFLLLGFTLYAPALQINSFFFDDKNYIQNNPAITSLNLGQLFEQFNTRFIPGLTFALNYQINGFNPTGYHVVNVVLHVINALLVYFLVMTTLALSQKNLSAQIIAALTALLFLLHPVQTGAVNYISQRTVLLAAFLYIGTLILYGRFLLTAQKKFYAGALMTAIAAMFCKEIAFSLPFMLVLYDFTFAKGMQRFRRLFPFLLCLFIIPLLLLRTDSSMPHMSRIAQIDLDLEKTSPHVEITKAGNTKLSRSEYFLTELNVLTTYLRLLVFPVGQSAWYDYPVTRAIDLKTLFSFLLLAALFAGGIYSFKKDKTRLFGFCIIAFFLTLALESSLIPIGHVIAEYRLYLGVVFFGFLFVTAATEILKNERRLVILVAVLLGLASILTFQRNMVWKSEEGLWLDVLKKFPQQRIAHFNLGAYYLDHGRFADALPFFHKAHELNPHPRTYNALALAYIYAGDLNSAEQYLTALAKLEPENAEMNFNFGLLYKQNGQLEKSLSYYQKGLALNPENRAVYREICDLYLKMGRLQESGPYCLPFDGLEYR